MAIVFHSSWYSLTGGKHWPMSIYWDGLNRASTRHHISDYTRRCDEVLEPYGMNVATLSGLVFGDTKATDYPPTASDIETIRRAIDEIDKETPASDWEQIAGSNDERETQS